MRWLSSFLFFFCFFIGSSSACSTTSEGTSAGFLYLDLDLVLGVISFGLNSGLCNSELATKLASGSRNTVSIVLSVSFF